MLEKFDAHEAQRCAGSSECYTFQISQSGDQRGQRLVRRPPVEDGPPVTLQFPRGLLLLLLLDAPSLNRRSLACVVFATDVLALPGDRGLVGRRPALGNLGPLGSQPHHERTGRPAAFEAMPVEVLNDRPDG